MSTRTEKIAAGSLVATVLSCLFAALVVPEVRVKLGLPIEAPVRAEQNNLMQTEPPAPKTVAERPGAGPIRDFAEERGRAPADRVLLVRSATASSILPPSRVAQYGPEMAIDGAGGTAWVENASGYGVGEWIELHFGAPRRVTALEFRNGYNKGARFQENGRLRSLTATFSTGETRTFSLADHPSAQRVTFAGISAQSVRLTINSVYEGSRWEDTALGDVRVIGY
jgi:hypothetical protein